MSSATTAAEEFRSSLSDLTVNSKPLISMLTMLAEENQRFAKQIVDVIENHVYKAKPQEKLPALYLIDSILKNIRESAYTTHFTQNIVNIFCHVFDEVEERTRQAMFKLRQTWSDVLPARKLYALDIRVNQIDPAWPVVAIPDTPPAANRTAPGGVEPSGGIHINPRFLQHHEEADVAASVVSKQDDLIKIEQLKLELELAKAKAQIEKQKLELEQIKLQQQAVEQQRQNLQQSIVISEKLLTDPQRIAHKPHDPRLVRAVPSDPRLAANSAGDPRLASRVTKPAALLPTPIDPRLDTPAAPDQRLLPSSVVKPRSVESSNADPRLMESTNVNLLPAAQVSEVSLGNVIKESRPISGVVAANGGLVNSVRTSAPMLDTDGWAQHFDIQPEFGDRSRVDSNRSRFQPNLTPRGQRADNWRPPPHIQRGRGFSRGTMREGGFRMERRGGDRPKLISSRIVRDRPLPYDRPTEKSGDAVEKSLDNKSQSSRRRSHERDATDRKERRIRKSRSPADARSRSPNKSDGRGIADKRQDRSTREPGSKADGLSRNSGSSNSAKVEPISKLEYAKSGDLLEAKAVAVVEPPSKGKVDVKPKDHSKLSPSDPMRNTDAEREHSDGKAFVTKFEEVENTTTEPIALPSSASQSLATVTTEGSKVSSQGDAAKKLESMLSNSEDIDLRKSGKDSRRDGGAAKPPTKRKAQNQSPAKGEVREAKQMTIVQDQDLRVPRDNVSTEYTESDQLTPEQKRNQRGKQLAEEWQQSKAKMLPKIPRKKVKGQYRSRDGAAAALFMEDNEERQMDIQPAVVTDAILASGGDPDLRVFPAVKMPVQKDTKGGDSDSSDSRGAEQTQAHRRRDKKNPNSSRGNMRTAVSTDNQDVDMRTLKKLEKENTPSSAPLIAAEDSDMRPRPGAGLEARDEDLRSGSDRVRERSSPTRRQQRQALDSASSSEDRDYRTLVPQSPGAHKDWNKFKLDNPKQFFAPKASLSVGPMDTQVDRKGSQEKSTSLRQLTLDDTGLELLDQKDVILEQASKQLGSGEINQKQYDEVKFRLQELQLIKHARQQQLKHFRGAVDPRLSPFNLPMASQVNRSGSAGADFSSGASWQGDMRLQRGPNDQNILNLLRMAAQAAPRMRAALISSQQAPAIGMVAPSPPGSGGAGFAALGLNSHPRGNADTRGPIARFPSTSPSHRMAGGLLPTPQSPSLPGRPLERMVSHEPVRRGRQVAYEVVIDGRPFELTMGMRPRKISIGHKDCFVCADKENREILIDGKCYYRLGEPMREFNLAGKKHTIFYQGPTTNIWIDGLQFDVRIDSPPKSVQIDGEKYDIQIEGHLNKIVIDGRDMGKFGGSKREVMIGGRLHSLQFEAPPRQIILDGKLCEIKSDGQLPVIIIDNKQHGIRFDGPPREILIDNVAYMIPMDRPLRVKVGMRAHMLGFGGPGNEVVVDGTPYEVVFDGPPRQIKIGGTLRNVRLTGHAPEVRILGEILPEEEPEVCPLPTGTRRPGLLPTPQLEPMREERAASRLVPSLRRTPPPYGLRDTEPTSRLEMPLEKPSAPMLAPSAGLAIGAAVTNIDIKDLFSKLLQHGIIAKKEEEKKIDFVPDITDFSDAKLKEKYTGVIQRLYTGNQCATCGLRFLDTANAKYNDHLDWHFRQNKRDKSTASYGVSRKWCISLSDWVAYEEFTDTAESNIFLSEEDRGSESAVFSSTGTQLHPDAVLCPPALGNEKDDSCCVCREPFERYWNDDEEAWHLTDALRVDQKTYHPVCYEDAVDTSLMDTASSVIEDTAVSESRPELESRNGGLPNTALTSITQPKEEPLADTKVRRPSGTSQVTSTPVEEKPIKADIAQKYEIKQEQSDVTMNIKLEPPSSDTDDAKMEYPPVTVRTPFYMDDIKVPSSPKEPTPPPKDAFALLTGLIKSVPHKPENTNAPSSSGLDQLPVLLGIKVEPISSPPQLTSHVTPPSPQRGITAPSLHTDEPISLSGDAVSASKQVVAPMLSPVASMPTGQRSPAHQGIASTVSDPIVCVGQPIMALGSTIPTIGTRPPRPAYLASNVPTQHFGAPLRPHLGLSMGSAPVATAQLHTPLRPPMIHGPPLTQPPQVLMHGPPPSFLPMHSMGSFGAPPMPYAGHFPPHVAAPAAVPYFINVPSQMSVAGDSDNQDDPGTPLRDERTDDVERCDTPVMDERDAGDDGGSTPVRDELE